MRNRPIHIENFDTRAKVAFIMGSPERAKRLSEMLYDTRFLSYSRSYFIYEGKDKSGEPVLVASHGLGGPSALVLIEELRMLGIRRFIRLGTTGGLTKNIKLGDIIVASGASIIPGTCGLSLYTNRIMPPLVADMELLNSAVSRLKSKGITPIIGPVFCSDSFYAETPDILREAARVGAVSVDMETGSLYGISAIRKLSSVSILVVSNIIQDIGEVFGDTELIRKRIDSVFEALIDVH